MVEAPILKFPYWSRQFHVHGDVSNVIVKAILAQPDEELTYRPNSYTSHKLNKAKRIYSMTEHEALEMIFYIDHQALKYLINKLVHQGWN